MKRLLTNFAILALVTGAPVCVADFTEVIAAGKSRYRVLCMSCHGGDGKGQVENLTIRPADLTVLARNNDGAFPFERVYDTVDGREMPRAHGDRKMPAWGAYLKRGWPGSRTEEDVRGQILEVLMFLLTLQEP